MKIIIYYNIFDPIYKMDKLIIRELYKKFDYIIIIVSESENTMFNIKNRIDFIDYYIKNNFPYSINKNNNKIHILKEFDFEINKINFSENKQNNI